MSRERVFAVAICFIVLATAVSGAASGFAGPLPGHAISDDSFTTETAAEPDPDSILLEIRLDERGDATWTVEYRIWLDDEERREAFESVRAEIEDDPANYTDRFANRMEETAQSAATATGREMTIENVTVEAETRGIQREYGVIAYEFEWRGFAVADGDELRAGDAIAGLILAEEERLLVTWPGEYALESVSPEPDERGDRLVWSGPKDFGSDEPRIVLTRTDSAGAFPGLPLVLLAILVVALGSGLWWYREGRSTTARPGVDADDGEPATNEPPEELLSNEERVLRLLEKRGGRIKQQEVVAELDWTAAKTSQVVNEMREGGTVDVFRIGRENVITLPDDDSI